MILMLKTLAKDMALSYYSDKAHDEGDIEVYAYGFERLVSSSAQVLFFLVLGLIAGQFFTTIAFLTAYMPLRNSIGGFHAKTHLRCFLTFFIIYLAHLAIIFLVPIEMISILALSFAAVSALPIFLYAPLSDINRPMDENDRKIHRRKSIIKYVVQALIIVVVSITGVLHNITFLTPFILLSFALGQLSAAGALVAAKIQYADS